ncbi:hypothetical protein PLIP_b0176 [Pseudoalteromonas lipolytica LMEB 39]|nr:hypothetical protein [Pseudoalteromonas lipolytica LMEB 39]
MLTCLGSSPKAINITKHTILFVSFADKASKKAHNRPVAMGY